MRLWRAIPIVLLIAMMVITPVMHSSSAIWIEYVGRQTVNSYVPYFVLYDPPGDGSYSTFTEEMTLTSTTTLSMKDWISKAEGTWSESWTVDTSYSTPDDQRKHFVIAKYLRITWDVWYYETISRSWYVAEYVSHTDLGGISFPSFDDLDTYDMFVVDQTGTQGLRIVA